MSTNLIIARPSAEEYPEWVTGYIATVQSENLLEALQASHDHNLSQIQTLNEEQLTYRYEPGKWTIKEVLGHIIDTERIMAYRALRFARKDKTPLPGFDQDLFVENAQTQQRDIQAIMKEYSAVRQANIELFRSFNEETLAQSGTANDRQISVRALGYTIAGHETHHWNIIKERYL
ncbi:MAG: DinB family protein [Bacteroidota bacterium]